MSTGKNKFFLKFWGVRGSYPVSGKNKLKIGGNTPCVEVRVDELVIIIDAGTGIINLGNSLIEEQKITNKPIIATILLSHHHYDHIQGFPFFKPAYIGSTKLFIFGPKSPHSELEEIFSRMIAIPYLPFTFSEMKSLKNVRSISETEVIILTKDSIEPRVRHVFREEKIASENPVIITSLRNYSHPREGVNIYKIKFMDKTVVYATDIEGYVGGDSRLINFAKYADVLIHDAQYSPADYTTVFSTEGFPYSKQGFGHSTYEMAAEVAEMAEVKTLFLFHHNPEYDDSTITKLERQAKKIFKSTFAAYEGMTVEI